MGSNFRRLSIVDPHHRMSIVDTDISSAGSERRGSLSGGGVSRGVSRVSAEARSEARGGDSREDESGESETSRVESAAVSPV